MLAYLAASGAALAGRLRPGNATANCAADQIAVLADALAQLPRRSAAREPILIEAPPSAKGVALVKSAMSALQNCQPYKMLPANLYGEWKIMDLPFSPRDFGS